MDWIGLEESIIERDVQYLKLIPFLHSFFKKKIKSESINQKALLDRNPFNIISTETKLRKKERTKE